MFPVSLPKGRFPSNLPSLKPSLGFPSMAGTTTYMGATGATGLWCPLAWDWDQARPAAPALQAGVHPYPGTVRCAQEWLPTVLE